MAKTRRKPIEQYGAVFLRGGRWTNGKKRVNNPPFGLVTPETDKENGKKSYAYDPHLDREVGTRCWFKWFCFILRVRHFHQWQR